MGSILQQGQCLWAVSCSKGSFYRQYLAARALLQQGFFLWAVSCSKGYFYGQYLAARALFMDSIYATREINMLCDIIVLLHMLLYKLFLSFLSSVQNIQ